MLQSPASEMHRKGVFRVRPAGATRPAVSRVFLLLAALVLSFEAPANPYAHWFETVKRTASPAELYRFLYAFPKGGDLHNHLGGSMRSEWWYEAALAQSDNGYRYYTKVRINNCRAYGGDEFDGEQYLLMFRTIGAADYQALSECEKAEYEPLENLSPVERTGWLDSIRLDKPHEARDEFFEAHWERIGGLFRNPYLIADLLVVTMEAYGAEGLMYLETQAGPFGFATPDGTPLNPDDAAAIFRERLAQPDAVASGVTVRLQITVLRFADNAEEQLRRAFEFISRNRDLYVGVNFAGREDDDKGYPLRFLPTLRELRRTYHSIPLSIHAGEVDEPNAHVRDTLLLGADRIGHGVNLITDPDTLLMMRHGPFMVEINLISNLLLDYVDDYAEHPFPEYLRLGVPVSLSTDDRGMWDSNMTDEYFVAVSEFNLSWPELVEISRNGIRHSFLSEGEKAELLSELDARIETFTAEFEEKGWAALDDVTPVTYGFMCRYADLCGLQ